MIVIVDRPPASINLAYMHWEVWLPLTNRAATLTHCSNEQLQQMGYLSLYIYGDNLASPST